MPAVEELVSDLRRDGFVFFRDFFPTGQADAAAAELLPYYDADLKERADLKTQDYTRTGAAGTTVLTAPSHLMIDVYGKSPTLDEMLERALTDPLSGGVLRQMAGRHIKLRGCNIRRMTGAFDPGPAYPRASTLPHEWHRDSPGELGVGILLTDIPEGGNAGTALVPGSHMFPYCPRWNTLFSSEYRMGPYLGNPLFARLAPCNRLLTWKVLGRRREAAGRRGDLFFFFNDVWHGRYPNLHGRQSMVMLMGCFPTDFAFPDQVTPPPADVLAKLPPALRLAASTAAPVNEERDTVVRWMLANRRNLNSLGLFNLARLERRLAEKLTTVTRALGRRWETYRHLLTLRHLVQVGRRVLSPLRRPGRSAPAAPADATMSPQSGAA